MLLATLCGDVDDITGETGWGVGWRCYKSEGVKRTSGSWTEESGNARKESAYLALDAGQQKTLLSLIFIGFCKRQQPSELLKLVYTDLP